MTEAPSSSNNAGTFDPDLLARHGFPTISYDDLVVGEEFRSDDRLIRPQDVLAYAHAVDDHDPLFFAEGPFGEPVVHPTLLANQALFLRHNRYVVPVGLHARMIFEFIAPIPLGTISRTLRQEQINIYSGVKPGSIHTDRRWAEAKGFRTTIAQGMMSTAYVSALMTANLGAGFITGGRMDVRFLRPVFEGDTLTVSGTVTGFDRTDEGVRLLADVEVRNQDDELTLAGTASGLSS